MKKLTLATVMCLVLVFAVGCSMMGNSQKILDDLKTAQTKIEDLTKENATLTDKVATLETQIEDFGDMDIEEIQEEMDALNEEIATLKTTNDSLIQVIEKLKAGSTSGGGSSGGGGHPTIPITPIK
ncbi:hypothetical protein JXL83_09320 [candidate division WOR-3 bacterium]|nr:hypothetical protein [candidate division WOR-3 bacterium]